MNRFADIFEVLAEFYGSHNLGVAVKVSVNTDTYRELLAYDNFIKQEQGNYSIYSAFYGKIPVVINNNLPSPCLLFKDQNDNC
jgi:hypothetical protein